MTRDRYSNVVWHHATGTRERRQAQNSYCSVVLWFADLSASGKPTLAHAMEKALHRLDCRIFVQDGNNVRHGLCADLGFNQPGRKENLHCIGELAKHFIGGRRDRSYRFSTRPCEGTANGFAP